MKTNRLFAGLALALLLLIVPAFAQDLSQFQSGSIEKVVVERDQSNNIVSVNLSVSVTKVGGQSYTWNHFLNADELTLWESGPAGKQTVAKKSMLKAYTMLLNQQASVPNTVTTPTVTVTVAQIDAQTFLSGFNTEKAALEADIATLEAQLAAKRATLAALIRDKKPQ